MRDIIRRSRIGRLIPKLNFSSIEVHIALLALRNGEGYDRSTALTGEVSPEPYCPGHEVLWTQGCIAANSNRWHRHRLETF